MLEIGLSELSSRGFFLIFWIHFKSVRLFFHRNWYVLKYAISVLVENLEPTIHIFIVVFFLVQLSINNMLQFAELGLVKHLVRVIFNLILLEWGVGFTWLELSMHNFEGVGHRIVLASQGAETCENRVVDTLN